MKNIRLPAGLLLLLLMQSPGVVWAVTRDEVVSWLEQYAGATTLDESPGPVRGDAIDQLRPYLPPGLIDEFAFPELEMEWIATTRFDPHQSYQQATAQYRGQATLAADGSLENYTVGQPFTLEQVEQATPEQAGLMLAWNHIHRWQYQGYLTNNLVMNYVDAAGSGTGELRDGFTGGGHISRFIAQGYYRVYLSHIASFPDNGYRIDSEDAGHLLWKDYMEMTEPFDVKGTKFVVERELDAHEDDQVNSYLPAERRVRRLSAKERADAFLGSNYSLDDFEGFSGRVLDFEWRYLGRKTILQIANARGPTVSFHGPNSRVPADRWQVRRCFAVELKPKWEGHPIARKVMFIDEETYNVDLALIFDHDDTLWKSIMTVYYRPPVSGPEAPPADTVSRWAASVAINYLKNDATVTRAIEPVVFHELSAEDIRRMFSVSKLTDGR